MENRILELKQLQNGSLYPSIAARNDGHPAMDPPLDHPRGGQDRLVHPSQSLPLILGILEIKAKAVLRPKIREETPLLQAE